MTFPSLPGPHNAHKRAALTCAAEELRYYAGKVCESLKIPAYRQSELAYKANDLITEIEAARTDNAAELFNKAWHLVRDMEKILKCR